MITQIKFYENGYHNNRLYSSELETEYIHIINSLKNLMVAFFVTIYLSKVSRICLTAM